MKRSNPSLFFRSAVRQYGSVKDLFQATMWLMKDAGKQSVVHDGLSLDAYLNRFGRNTITVVSNEHTSRAMALLYDQVKTKMQAKQLYLLDEGVSRGQDMHLRLEGPAGHIFVSLSCLAALLSVVSAGRVADDFLLNNGFLTLQRLFTNMVFGNEDDLNIDSDEAAVVSRQAYKALSLDSQRKINDLVALLYDESLRKNDGSSVDIDIDRGAFQQLLKNQVEFLWQVYWVIYDKARELAPANVLPSQAQLVTADDIQRCAQYMMLDLRNLAYPEVIKQSLTGMTKDVPVVIAVGSRHVFRKKSDGEHYPCLYRSLGREFCGRKVQYVLAQDHLDCEPALFESVRLVAGKEPYIESLSFARKQPLQMC